MGNVIALMGPTAAGKTGLAMALCARFDLDLISVDSALVYRGMDIGTAKPTAEEQARVPHRLIDLCDPACSYSAGQFRRDALREIDAIHAAGRVPLLAGGTMLYFRALFDGIDDLPRGDDALRVRLDSQAGELGWPAMHARLASIDPIAAQRIHANDSQRIQRALEVYEVSGRTMTDWHAGETKGLDHRVLKLALLPGQRDLLHARIAQRFDAMLHSGLVEEVRSLHARTDLSASHSAMRAVGYRQIWRYLDGKVSLEQAVADAQTATRRLAKRQLTWLRSETDLVTLDPFDAATTASAVGLVHEWLAADRGQP